MTRAAIAALLVSLVACGGMVEADPGLQVDAGGPFEAGPADAPADGCGLVWTPADTAGPCMFCYNVLDTCDAGR